MQRNIAMFTPEYIFEYDKNVEKSEKDKLYQIPINDYIIQRKCYLHIFNQVQKLINEQGQPIGSLLILNRKIPSSPTRKNNINMVQKNNEAQKNDRMRNNMEVKKNIEMENQKKKQAELINNNNNLNNQINYLKQELNKKDIQNQNIKNELNKLKKENAIMIRKNIEKKILSIQSIESIMYPMKKNEIELLNFKQKENQYIQINKDLQEKQNVLNQLKETYNKLSKNVADLSRMKDKLDEEINQKKREISNINDIINLKNNYDKEIKKLNLELKQKNDQLSNIDSIKNDFENKNKELLKQYNAKEMDLNNIKLELQQMKMNEPNLNLIKNKENEINKRSQELKDKEKNLNSLIEKYKNLDNINKNLENSISDLSKKKQNLIDEIKQYEEMKSNKRESIVNTNNILNKKLKELEKELQQKNKQLSDNNLIKLELDKVIKEKNELNKQLFDKEDEIKMLKSEMNQMKINEINLNSLNQKNKELTEANKKLNNDNYDLMNKNKKLLEEKKQNEEVESSKKNELINKNNNLIKQINEMQKILEQKDKQIININLIKKDLEKLSKENKELFEQKNEKEKELNAMRLKINQMERNELNSHSLQNKEIEINKKLKELNEKENNLIFLNKRNKELTTENKNLENQISNLNKNKQKLNDELKKLELQILNKKEALEKLNFNQNQNQINNNDNRLPRPKSSNQLMNNQININSPQKMNMISSPNQINNSPLMNNFVQNNNNQQNQNRNVFNIPPPPAPKKPGPISTYTKPTLIGLNNIGSTCYKNAVLECLSQTKDLTNCFLREDNYNKIINNNIAKKNPGTKTLCSIYYNLIKNLWKKNATFKSFSPDEFMNSISEMTKNDQVQFSLYEAGDAKDFIIYILERMHNELKQPVKNKFWKLGPNDKLNQYDKNNAFLFFLDEFQNDTSIISDLFYGFTETTNVCQFCKNKYNSNGQIEPICYNYGIFNILIFPLEEVRKYREQMMKITNTNINIGAMANVVSLFECFFYNQKSDYFTGDNKNYCNICRQLYDSVYTSKIFVSPNILIMILNRGKGNIFNIKLDFSLQIDITDFVLTKSQNREIYNLYGVITHLGQSGPNAHFVAACKSPVDGNWYRYNDAIVTPINNFQNDIYNFGTPYILFYEKQK